jgi:cell division protein FtsW
MTANVSINESQKTPVPILSSWQSLMVKGDFSQLMAVNMNALVWSWLGLMALGWVMVMSASTSIAETYTGNAAYFSIRHGVYIVLGIIVAFFFIRI